MAELNRYHGATLIALLLVALGLSLGWFFQHTVKGAAVDFGTTISSSDMIKVQIADLLLGLWWIRILVVFAICFVVAWLLPREQPH